MRFWITTESSRGSYHLRRRRKELRRWMAKRPYGDGRMGSLLDPFRCSGSSRIPEDEGHLSPSAPLVLVNTRSVIVKPILSVARPTDGWFA